VVRLTDESAVAFDWLNDDVRTLREDYERVRAKTVPPDALSLRIGGVDVLRFAGHGAWGGAIVYFHGGGFIVGSPVTHADIAARLAHHTGLPVYSVAYRLAPDHKAPAPAEDGIAVIRHLVESGVEQLALCGDSAGGAIALATEASLSDDLRGHVRAVASFYGAYGLLDTASLLTRGSRADGTDRDCVARYFALAGREAYTIETLARPSPVPVYLLAAEDDALRDDTLALARAMEAQGRPVTVDRTAGVDHGFLHGGKGNADAEAALARFATWLNVWWCG
jgi:acetyl esterase/lipase